MIDKKFNIIGVDCAVDPRKVGLALSRIVDGKLTVIEAMAGSSANLPVDVIGRWIDTDMISLIAIDSPLGWPQSMGHLLSKHQAGNALPIDAHDLFRRETDQFIRQEIGKQTLDVGADHIARTAHAAVKLIDELRNLTGKSLPLCWDHSRINEDAIIEVYPAGTLHACKLPCTGYKGKHIEERSSLIKQLLPLINLDRVKAKILEDDDVLDAVICTLCGFDFLQGRSIPPADVALARKEGWIWVRGGNSC